MQALRFSSIIFSCLFPLLNHFLNPPPRSPQFASRLKGESLENEKESGGKRQGVGVKYGWITL